MEGSRVGGGEKQGGGWRGAGWGVEGSRSTVQCSCIYMYMELGAL